MRRPAAGRRAVLRLTALTLAASGALAVAGTIAAPAASAHAVLVSSSPVDGSRVNTEPAQVRLTFDEPVGLITADEQVISATGQRADTGQVRLAGGGTTIVLPLKPHLPHGTYSATWRVVSADTHVVTGSITFGLGVEPGAGVAAVPDRTGQLDATADVAEGLIYLGLVLLAGMTAAARLLWPWALRLRRIRGLAWAGWAALAAGTAAEFVLQGPRAVNAGWAAVFRLRDASGTLGSPFGQELAARLALLLLVTPLLLRRGPARQWPNGRRGRALDILHVVAGLALLVSIAVAGHEAAGADVALAFPAAILHLASMATWLGGLVLLGLAVLPAVRRGTITELRLRHWSITAYSCVICLVVSGEYQASRQVSPVQALWSTRYGILLLVKVALVAVMLAAAFLAERRITGPPATSAAPDIAPGGIRPDSQVRAVRRSVAIEIAAAVLVLAVTAVLVSEPPARTTFGPPVTLSAPLGPDHVSVHIDTTRRGAQAMTLRVLNAAGAPVPASSMTAALSSPQVAALRVTLRRLTPDGSQWTTSAAIVPLPGVWTLTLDIALGPADAYATSASYRVWLPVRNRSRSRPPRRRPARPACPAPP
jgi:copper transport protein